MLTIDGSFGEGGGQILRSSLALSLVTGMPIKMINIRAGRKKPGLGNQHLTCVRAAAEVGAAEVSGDQVRSQRIEFHPRPVRPGFYRFSVGTAGSTTLVLQTILPALILAPGPSEVLLEGGTHNIYAPPYDFLANTFLPILNRMGPRVRAKLRRPGFFPAGGGRIDVTITPAEALTELELPERGAIERVRSRALVSNLPTHIGERENKVIQRALGLESTATSVEEVHSSGPGNAVLIQIECQHITEVVTGFGQRGVRAEKVARNAAVEAQRYLNADVPVGEHLADQLLLPLALAGGGRFTTMPLSTHATTNIEVIKMFLPVDFTVDQLTQESVSLVLRGTG